MKKRFVKWESEYGTAYAAIPENYPHLCIVGAATKVLVSVAVSDPLLCDVEESEFREWVDGVWENKAPRQCGVR